MAYFKPKSFPRSGVDIMTTGGFTLLEVMVAIAILGVTLITLFELFSGTLKLARVSEDYLKATLLAQKKMNDLRLKNFILEEGKEAGGFEEDPDYKWSVTMEPYKTEFKRGKEKEEIKKVELRVLWKSGARHKEFNLVRLYNPMTWNHPDMHISKKTNGEKEAGPKAREAEKEKAEDNPGQDNVHHISGN